MLSVAVEGSTIYVGGGFSTVGGQPRSRIAAINSATGAVTSWNPNANNTVYTINASDGKIYVGGIFTTIGGQSRSRIAALDAVTGTATSWNPSANNAVFGIAINDGKAYVGGGFTSIGGQSRNMIAALDITSGIATSWNPNANETVYTVAVDDNMVYAGGDFTNIGGQGRNRVASFDAATGAVTSWNPDVNGIIYSIALSGSRIFVGGNFTSVGIIYRPMFAVFSNCNLTTTATQINASCNGGSGSATATPVGGSGTYNYSWNTIPVQNTATATGLAAGDYTVTVSDSNGCEATANVTITQPASALSATATVTNVLCFGASTGAIDITPSGGTPPYTYNWGGGITTQDRTGLASGNYSVTITDGNGCTTTVNSTVTQPATTLSASATVTNVLCFGASTGAIDITPSGGTTPYTYNWGGGITTQDRTALASGNYSVTITDVNGCTTVVNSTVTQPASALSATATVTTVLCFGASTGAIDITPSGGTPPYTYNWGGGITSQDRTGLASGNYSVIITDGNGCTTTVNSTVTQPASALSATATVTTVLCFGASTGAIDITPSGGTPPYTYNWGGGITTQDRTGLASGNYSVIITDGNGCTTVVNSTVTQPASALSATATVTNVLCFGASTGAIDITPSGGTTPYTYNWGGGITTQDRTALASGNYSVTITDGNGCTTVVNSTVTQPASALSATATVTNVLCFGASTGAIDITPSGGTTPYTYNWGGGITSQDRTGLASGNYSVIITDGNGCTATVNSTVTQPASALSATATVTTVLCFGASTGAIDITPSGGTPPYTYNWGGGITTQDKTGLASGNYSVTITDGNGCTTVVNSTVTQPASALSATATVTNVLCFGASTGAIDITPSGGTTPYSYNWGGGITTQDRTVLASGNYSVTITDGNGCTTVVNSTVTQPDEIVINDQPQDDTVNTGGNADFTITATNADSYQWQVSTNGDDWEDVSDGGTNPAYSGAMTSTLNINNVPLGFNGYLYRVVLANGTDCTTVSSEAVLSVSNNIEAVDDDFSAVVINEGVGGTAGDVTLNDLLNGEAVNDNNITITIINNDGLTGATINESGVITVPAAAAEGTYTVIYSICENSDTGNCSEAEAIIVVGPPLKAGEFDSTKIDIYPNPASTEVLIRIPVFPDHENLKLAVYDIHGRLVREQRLYADIETVNISALEDGVYIFSISSDRRNTNKKIIKKR